MTMIAAMHTTREHLEGGAPSDDTRAFRRCLGQYATGVAVVTAAHNGRTAGMTINSFASVSLEPPLILWSIRKASASAPVFIEADHFAINMLACEQVGLSQRFGASDPNALTNTPWRESLHGDPLLDGAIGHLACKRASVYEGGDHWILVGEVEWFARFSGEPLLFSQGQYAVAHNHPQLGTGAAPSHRDVREPTNPSFLTLLSTANHRTSAQFEEHRRTFGVTVASGRILNRLYDRPLERDELARTTFLGEATLDDAIRELCAQGHISKSGMHYQLTQTGRNQRAALAKKAQAFTTAILSRFSSDDVAIAARVLNALAQE